ncbi:unnamed protein product [Lactuca virosa]|uniref:Cyclic nucleotide-binding domain-containing protein n=1 Tax=Lactuca virosa TaxID=75947 RepID=A0AAU9PID0_9ASTR|nr:unnamed protein product [Lactuca virosa]
MVVNNNSYPSFINTNNILKTRSDSYNFQKLNLFLPSLSFYRRHPPAIVAATNVRLITGSSESKLAPVYPSRYVSFTLTCNIIEQLHRFLCSSRSSNFHSCKGEVIMEQGNAVEQLYLICHGELI